MYAGTGNSEIGNRIHRPVGQPEPQILKIKGNLNTSSKLVSSLQQITIMRNTSNQHRILRTAEDCECEREFGMCGLWSSKHIVR